MTDSTLLLDRPVPGPPAAALADLVTRYLPLVYAAAKRRTGDAALADDVCQPVFLVLAKKLDSLDTRRPLGEWLLTVTRYAAANAVRQRARRAKHERQAAAEVPEAVMTPADSSVDAQDPQTAWEHHLDAALDRLSAVDRQAVLLRFYDGADFPAVAAALNVTEAAARKRVSRAVERMRSVFRRRGVVVPGAAIAAALPATLALTPPAALAATVTATATTSAAASAGTALLAKGTLKTMLLAKAKTVVAASLAVVLAAGGATGVGYVALAQSPATSAITPITAKPVVGWLRIENKRSPAGPLEVYYIEPSTGRRMMIDGSADGGQVVRQSRDPVSGVGMRFLAETNQFVIGMAGDDHEMDIGYTEKEFLSSFIGEPTLFKVTARPAIDGERVTDIVTDTQKGGANSGVGLPAVMEMHTDVATGVVKRITAMPSKDGETPAFDVVAITAVDGPPVAIDQPDKMRLPAGATLIDNRPSPEIRALLNKLEDVVQSGPGFDVGLIVRRNGNVYTGEAYDDSADITLCAGTADRFVIATWNVGKESGRFFDEKQTVPKPAGWPTPTLPAVLDAVGQTRPNRFVVYDGQTCWASNNMIGGRKDPVGRTVTQQQSELWRNWSIAGQLWGMFPTRGSLFTKYALIKDKGVDTRVMLEAVTGDYFTYGAEIGPRIHKGATIRMKLATDLGPYPLRVETISDGDLSLAMGRGVSRMIWDIEDSPKWMFRNPVRVPEHWRRLSLDDGAPSLPEYYTLIPYENGLIPDAWFDDPAKTWPVK